MSYHTRWMTFAKARLPLLILAIASLRLCHVNLLWSDEDYHLGAALQVLHGRIPYKDFWYDKPPLAALYYLLIGAHSGWLLRVLDTLYILIACRLAFHLARAWWSETEGFVAAFLLAFFTTFYLPAAIIPFAVDALLLVPHLVAILFAKQRRPIASGLVCAICLLVNIKGAFVAAACALWLASDLPLFLLGLLLPLALAVLATWFAGALPAAYLQIWQWGLHYATGSSLPGATLLGLKRCAGWLGFHAALAAGVAVVIPKLSKDERFRLGTWFALCAVSLTLGNHFAPRYFLQLLPVMVIAASHGIVLSLHRWRRPAIAALALLLAIPFIRFAPHYITLLIDNIQQEQPIWTDAALDLDSQNAATIIRNLAKPNDTLFVWGYRPDLYIYTRLISPDLFWDSQPLTGVPADRHLTISVPAYNGPAYQNRLALTHSKPTFVVDGLGLLNPSLSPAMYPELKTWLDDYQLVARTKLCLIYRLRTPSANQPERISR